MKNTYLWFEAPGKLSVQQETLGKPAAGEALVRTQFSAISAGTELLLYNGELPDTGDDTALDSLSGQLSYPTRYGYAAVGEIIEIGKGVDKAWRGRQVFAFNAHQSHFILPAEQLQPVPDGVDPRDAVFLANMETAVNLLQDARPLLGERVAIIGQGVVGLLSTALAAYFPLAQLITIDPVEMRRHTALSLGAHAAFSPDELPADLAGQFDLILELSGNPTAIDNAIHLATYDARILLGSWYGAKRAPLELGGDFHRRRIQLISSQVSTIAPALRGRWDKARRFALAWEMLARIKPARLVTGTFPLAEAPTVYADLARDPAAQLQVLFSYSG